MVILTNIVELSQFTSQLHTYILVFPGAGSALQELLQELNAVTKWLCIRLETSSGLSWDFF